MGSIYEIGPNEYLPTPFSKALKEPIYRDAYPTMFVLSTFGLITYQIADHLARFDLSGPSFFALPELLLRTQYKNPDKPKDGAFQLGHDTNDHIFEWMSQHPKFLSNFQNHMAGYRTGRSSWMDTHFYPVKDNLIKDARTDEYATFLVDVGGGKGHDLRELCQKHPALPGKLVLQEIKGVIEEAKSEGFGLDGKAILAEHDFFTKQPIIGMFIRINHNPSSRRAVRRLTPLGARAYYMHSCLHDWPDSKAHDILTNLKPGLTKGYSKLLINEHVIPDQGAHWLSTALDIVMMVNFSARERTEHNWRALLDSAGFKIIKIWTCEPGTESLIEAEPV